MNKIVTWFLGFTKLGKVSEKVQGWLSGKKAYLAGTGMMIPALITIISAFADQGMGYLTGIHGTPEFKQLMEGWAIIALRAGLAKAAKP